VLQDAERYEIWVGGHLKEQFLKAAFDSDCSAPALLRRFMTAFVADPVRVQELLLRVK